MRELKIIFTTLLLALVPLAGVAADMGVIEQRMFESFKIGAPATSEVESIVAMMSPEGSFRDIDYLDEEFNSGDKKRPHLHRTLRLAKAYCDPTGKYYKSEELYTEIEKLIAFWIKSDLDDINWWHRSIGFPKDLMPIVVLMREPLAAQNPDLLTKATRYLGASWESMPPRFKTGANGTDLSKITFAKAVLTNDGDLVDEVMQFVGSLIFVAKGGIEEGIYPDFSFSQHSANGRQLYLGTYGREYLDGVLFFLEFTNATAFALSPDKVSLIEHLVSDGVAWMWYRNELDPNQCGRKIYDKTNFAPSFVAITKRLLALNTPHHDKIDEVLAMMEGRRELIGNKAYPYHDYMIQRGEGYMTTIRMTSTRTVGNEAGNGQGLEHYHTGDGATYFKVAGDEYSPIFGTWNWRFIPGTTVVADSAPMPQPMWGKGGIGGNDFAGVASDGKVGVAGFIFAKDQLTAHKSWFNFENFTIALGAGITTARDDAKVITTVNQTSLKGKVISGKCGVWHNEIGYRSLTEQPIAVATDDKKSILMLSINHQRAPQDGSYAYAVYPNITFELFDIKVPHVELLSNNSSIQALRNIESGVIMAVFYEAGELAIDRRITLTLSQPAVAMLTPRPEGGYDAVVGNPLCENGTMESLEITMRDGKRAVEIEIAK